jgi:hypothetical protein
LLLLLLRGESSPLLFASAAEGLELARQLVLLAPPLLDLRSQPFALLLQALDLTLQALVPQIRLLTLQAPPVAGAGSLRVVSEAPRGSVPGQALAQRLRLEKSPEHLIRPAEGRVLFGSSECSLHTQHADNRRVTRQIVAVSRESGAFVRSFRFFYFHYY